MTDLTLTDTQAAAVKSIKNWFTDLEADCPIKQDFFAECQRFDFDAKTHQQVYRIFGYAGTGKSTIVDYAIKELGLSPGIGGVLFGTFTGKAAYVLRRKGVPTAQTIHSMIYAVTEATEQQIAEQKTLVQRLYADMTAAPGGFEKIDLQTKLAMAEERLRDMHKPQFGPNPNSPVRDCRLVVLDEVSMVNDQMAADLLAFGKPILVLGDPGQLPPIKGEGAFTQQDPDVMLTEIHRQAAESPIIHLATLAREGSTIHYGAYGDMVAKMRRSEVAPELLLNADQVIVGMNATRLALNNAMRGVLGRQTWLPVGPDDKIICLRNQNDIGLINGMFITLDQIKTNTEKPDAYFDAIVRNDMGDAVGGRDRHGKERFLSVYIGDFLDHFEYDKERGYRDYREKRRHVNATFGYAITCHKSQGSSWDKVCVWDDGLGRTREDRKRWLYTAITRAETGLLLLD